MIKNIDHGTNGISEKLNRSIKRERRKVKYLTFQFSTSTYFTHQVIPVFGSEFLKGDEVEDYLLNLDGSIKYANQKYIQKHTVSSENLNQTLILQCKVDEEGFIDDEEPKLTIKYSTKKNVEDFLFTWLNMFSEMKDIINRIQEIRVSITGNTINSLELTVDTVRKTLQVEHAWIENIIPEFSMHARFYHTCYLSYKNIGSQFDLTEFTPSLVGEI